MRYTPVFLSGILLFISPCVAQDSEIQRVRSEIVKHSSQSAAVPDILKQIRIVSKASTSRSIQFAATVEETAWQGGLDDIDEMPEQFDQANKELLSLVSFVSKSISTESERQQEIFETIENEIATTDDSSWQDKLVELVTDEPVDNTDLDLPENIPDLVQEDFQIEVFDQLIHKIVTPVGMDPTRTGQIIDQESGTPRIAVPIKVTSQNSKDQLEISVIRTDQHGQFTIPLSSGDRLIDVRPGGNHAPLPDVQLHNFALPNPTRWSSSDLEQLSDGERQRLVRLFGNVYELWIRLVTGREVIPSQVNQLSVVEKSRRAILGLTIVDAVMGQRDVSLTDMLILETKLTQRLAENSIWKNLANAWEGTRLNQVVGTRSIKTIRRPFDITVKTDGSIDQETVRLDVEQLARRIQTLQDDLMVRVLDQKQSLMFLRFQSGTVSSDRLQSELDTWSQLNSGIEFAEVALSRRQAGVPDDPHYNAIGSWGQAYADQWALKRLGLFDVNGEQPQSLFSNSTKLEPCIVAVIGSGVDWTHPELAGQVWVNTEEDPYNKVDDDGNRYTDDLFGWNFRDETNNVMDYGGHDTHVAGVIAARCNNGRGIAGVNPAARIMAIKAANFLGATDSVAISRAIYYAVDNGARVINISYWGESSSRAEFEAVEYARSEGAIVVVPSGNLGSDISTSGLASISGVFTVSGSTQKDLRAPFSGWGATIDIAAPATDILSLRARGSDFLLGRGDNQSYVPGRAFVGLDQDLYRASGTSFAAGLVSGAASRIFSSRPELNGRQVSQMLMMTAEDIDDPGWDQNSGAGRLNLQAALSVDPDDYLEARISRLSSSGRGEKKSIEVHGKAAGNNLSGRWIQIAPGGNPRSGDWKTVSFSRNSVADGLLGLIPMKRFGGQRGIWSIRILAQDEGKNTKQASTSINLQ